MASSLSSLSSAYSLPHFEKFVKPLDENRKVNARISKSNHEKAQVVIDRVFEDMRQLPECGRIKPSSHVPNHPVKELRGSFQQLETFVNYDQVNDVVKMMAWMLFPDNEDHQREMRGMFPDGTHEKDVLRLSVLFQDYWLWLLAQPDFDGQRLLASDALPVERDEVELKIFHAVTYLPIQAAFHFMDTFKTYIQGRVKHVDDQTRGMFAQMKMYFAMWLLHKRREMLRHKK
jgi:hypothetical protein